jgi:hypothetical protein
MKITRKSALLILLIAIVVVASSLLLNSCTDNDIPGNPPQIPNSTSDPILPTVVPPITDTSTVAPLITRENVFTVLNNQDFSVVIRSFEFKTETYKSKIGGILGIGEKMMVGVKGNGDVSITLSSSFNVVVNNTEKRISIAFGKTSVEATTDIPENLTFYVSDEKNMEKLEKSTADFTNAMVNQDGKKGWDKDGVASIFDEITTIKDAKEIEEKTRYEEDVKNAITNQLKQRYQISDYSVEILFD